MVGLGNKPFIVEILNPIVFSGGFGDFDLGSEVKVVVKTLDSGAEAGLTCCF